MTTSLRLTKRQEQVLEYLRDNSALYIPTFRQIGSDLGIKSPNGVMCHLRSLMRRGLVRKVGRRYEVVT